MRRGEHLLADAGLAQQEHADVASAARSMRRCEVAHRLVENHQIALPATITAGAPRSRRAPVCVPGTVEPRQRRVGDHHPAASDLDAPDRPEAAWARWRGRRAPPTRVPFALPRSSTRTTGTDVQARVQPRDRGVLDADRRVGRAAQRQMCPPRAACGWSRSGRCRPSAGAARTFHRRRALSVETSVLSTSDPAVRSSLAQGHRRLRNSRKGVFPNLRKLRNSRHATPRPHGRLVRWHARCKTR